LYWGTFGVIGGRAVVSQLALWVNVLGKTTGRGFCRDECVAISMFAACQHQTCPAMRACAFALVESSMIDGIVEQAQGFADTLYSLDPVLSPASIVNAPAQVNLPISRLESASKSSKPTDLQIHVPQFNPGRGLPIFRAFPGFCERRACRLDWGCWRPRCDTRDRTYDIPSVARSIMEPEPSRIPVVPPVTCWIVAQTA
jgi:hypothetical protein